MACGIHAYPAMIKCVDCGMFCCPQCVWLNHRGHVIRGIDTIRLICYADFDDYVGRARYYFARLRELDPDDRMTPQQFALTRLIQCVGRHKMMYLMWLDTCLGE